MPVAVVTDDPVGHRAERRRRRRGVVDLDEELHPDDVEEPLDTLLQERTASATLEDDEEELEDEEIDVDERADGPTRIVPRRPDEFLCQSCFLLLPLRRLADQATAVLRRLRLSRDTGGAGVGSDRPRGRPSRRASAPPGGGRRRRTLLPAVRARPGHRRRAGAAAVDVARRASRARRALRLRVRRRRYVVVIPWIRYFG